MKRTTKKTLRTRKVKATSRRISRSKSRRRLPHHRYETWQNYRVSIIRSPNGRFLYWHRTRTYTRRKLAEAPRGKRVAVYGSKDGKHRRWVITGTGKKQYQAIRDVAIHHPPRRQFQTIDAEDLLDDPLDYIGGYWDDHPRVES